MVDSASISQHLLARRARDLSRRIYTSFPWGFRVAEMLTVLAADSLDAFGRTMYAEFIKSVVRGMPNTSDGRQAYDLIQDVERGGADVLPAGYGRPFATRVYKMLLTKFSDPEVAEEAMANVMLQATRGKIHIANGSDMHSAGAYIITSVLNAARSILRSKGRRREVPLVDERDDNREVDIADPDTFRDLDTTITPREMERLLDSVGAVHPRARDYLEAVLRGDSQADWARDLGVTDAAVSKFVRKLRPTLQQKLREHFRAATLMASRSAYDYRR